MERDQVSHPLQAKPPKSDSGVESGVYEGVTFDRRKLGERIRRRRFARLVMFGGVLLTAIAVVLVMAIVSIREPHNSAWLWRPELYFGPDGHARFRKVAREWDVHTLYMQVHHIGLELSNTSEMQALLKAAHREGIEVQALAGSPEWGDPRHLEYPLSLIDAVAKFNKESSARFAGVHYDIEPYQLPLFALEPDKVMQNFLAVVSSISNRARAQNIFVAYSFPFFLNQPLDFRGERLPVYQHIMRRSDGSALMAYRTNMEGKNGFEALTRDVREFARSSRHVARTFLGVELTTGTAKTIRFLTAVEPPPAPEEIPAEFNGYTVRLLHPDRIYLLGLAPQNAATPPADGAVLSALAASVNFSTTSEAEVLESAARELQSTREFGNISQVSGGTAYGKTLTLVECTEVLSEGITFAEQPAQVVRQFTDRITRELVQPPKIMGVAFHDFEALDRLTGK